jgi:hypothetical protein
MALPTTTDGTASMTTMDAGEKATASIRSAAGTRANRDRHREDITTPGLRE